MTPWKEHSKNNQDLLKKKNQTPRHIKQRTWIVKTEKVGMKKISNSRLILFISAHNKGSELWPAGKILTGSVTSMGHKGNTRSDLDSTDITVWKNRLSKTRLLVHYRPLGEHNGNRCTGTPFRTHYTWDLSKSVRLPHHQASIYKTGMTIYSQGVDYEYAICKRRWRWKHLWSVNYYTYIKIKLSFFWAVLGITQNWYQ